MVPDTMIPPEGRIVRCGRCAHEWFYTLPVSEPVSNALSDTSDLESVLHALHPGDAPPAAEEAETALPDTLEAALASLIAAEEDAHAPAPSPAAAAAKSAQLPALTRAGFALDPKPFKLAVPALAACWLLVSFVAYFPSWMTVPGLSALYGAFGVRPLTGLVFDDVHLEQEEDKESGKTRYILTGSIQNESGKTRTVPSVRVELHDKENRTLWGREYPVDITLKGGDTYPFRIPNVETAQGASVSTMVVDMGHRFDLMVR